MRNLAGVADCDRAIDLELKRAKINAVDCDVYHGEVSYSVIGELGTFKFSRAWSYWIVEGKVPLSVAEELYRDPAGATDIRVAGHCACPPPGQWVKHVDSAGRKLVLDVDRHKRQDLAAYVAKGFCSQEQLDELHFADSDEELQELTAQSYIDLYHIDSELGLRLFADAVRNLGGEDAKG